MKIKEVCRRTCLTQRAVRFYEEKGLIAPEKKYKNGKEFREYHDRDVSILMAVSDLRRVGFSVEAIGQMISDPALIPDLTRQHLSSVRAELVRSESITAAVQTIDLHRCSDVFSMAEEVRNSSGAELLPKPDLEPDFPKLDSLSDVEKEAALEEFRRKQAVKDYISDKAVILRRKVLRRVGLLLVLFLIVFGLSWVPKTVDLSNKGYACKGSAEYDSVLEIKGRIYTPLFFRPFFTGDITLDGDTIHCDSCILSKFGCTDWYYQNFLADKCQGWVRVISKEQMLRANSPYKYEIHCLTEDLRDVNVGLNIAQSRSYIAVLVFSSEGGGPTEESIYYASGAMDLEMIEYRNPYYQR